MVGKPLDYNSITLSDTLLKKMLETLSKVKNLERGKLLRLES